MRGACSATVETEIVTTPGIEPLMPQQLFDMSDRTAVKEESRGHGVAEKYAGSLASSAGPMAVDRERVFDSIFLQGIRSASENQNHAAA